jgi:hypothetical protein
MFAIRFWNFSASDERLGNHEWTRMNTNLGGHPRCRRPNIHERAGSESCGSMP